MSRLCKIVFLLWMVQVRAAVKQKLDCGKEKRKINVACEGENITLTCPERKPWMKITSATFGRTEPETKICLRPGNFNATQSESVNCGTDVAMKVEAICADQRTCFFNVNDVTFTNPCPADVYKYLWVNFECSCRRRFTRTKAETTSTTCKQRRPNKTSSAYTVIHSTPVLTTIGQSMSQNITHSTIVTNSKYIINSTYVPIRMTVKSSSTVSTRSFTIKLTPSVAVLQNLTGRHVRNKAFFLLLELFVIYNEAANEDPPMALMWCFIGILLGLFIITITFLILGLRRKSKQKNLFRLSQLESEGEGIESPTIQTASQFPESPDSERRQTAIGKLNATRNGPVSKHFPGMGSWSDLLKADTSLYINPLWRGWQEEYLSLTAQNREEELDAGQEEREGLSRSEPWNLSAPAQSRDMDHQDGNCNDDSTSNGNRNSSNSDNSNQSNSGNDNNDSNDEQPDTSNTNSEHSQPSTSNAGLSRVLTKERRSAAESDPNLNSIPVGIPSHTISDPKIFHAEPPRIKKPEEHHTKHEAIETKQHVAGDNGNEMNTEKPSSFHFKNPSNKLLSKFGIDFDDNCLTPSLSNTAMSSPCLYNEVVNHPIPGKQDLKDSSHPVTNSSLIVRSKPIRSRSLDFCNPPDTNPLHNTYNAARHNPTPNKFTTQTPTANHPTTGQHQNKPPPFVKNKNNQNLWPQVLVDDKTNNQNQAQNEPSENIPVATRPPKKSPTHRRTSSGYYSNNTSPLVEYPTEITSPQSSANKAEQKPQRQPSLKQQKSEDDDLPPLPPPPPPLIPISPLPHMCISGYQEPKRHDNSSRTAGRKVHFKSSE